MKDKNNKEKCEEIVLSH